VLYQLAGRFSRFSSVFHPTSDISLRRGEPTLRADAVEKGKNEPTEIFACAPAASGFV
jgi:hypothetical protein